MPLLLLARAARALVPVACLLLLGVAACSSPPLKSAGTLCHGNGECGAGLSCLVIGAYTDAGCSAATSACSRTCTLDADCAPLGAAFKCFAACDGTRSCGATQ